MFSLDRETMMLIALAMCVLGSLYLYSELKSTRNDVSEMKTFSSQMANHLNSLSYYDDGMSEEDDEDYTLLKERQIYKCINEGRNISRWIVRILREVLEQRDEVELFKTFFEDDYYFKFHADKLKKLSAEWKEGRIKGYIDLNYNEWIISKYKDDRIYDLLDALHWFTKNNNCCNRHKNDFPVWNGSIDSSYLDYCERCEIEEEDLEEELFKDDYLSDYHLKY